MPFFVGFLTIPSEIMKALFARGAFTDAAAREAGQGSLQATMVTDPGRSIFVVGPGLAVGAER